MTVRQASSKNSHVRMHRWKSVNWKPDCFFQLDFFPDWFYSVLQKSKSPKVAEIFSCIYLPFFQFVQGGTKKD